MINIDRPIPFTLTPEGETHVAAHIAAQSPALRVARYVEAHQSIRVAALLREIEELGLPDVDRRLAGLPAWDHDTPSLQATDTELEFERHRSERRAEVSP